MREKPCDGCLPGGIDSERPSMNLGCSASRFMASDRAESQPVNNAETGQSFHASSAEWGLVNERLCYGQSRSAQEKSSGI